MVVLQFVVVNDVFFTEMCPPWHSSSTTLLTCVNKLGQPIKCTEATDETTLTYECASYYEMPLGQRRTIFCLDGTWSHPKPECQPGLILIFLYM